MRLQATAQCRLCSKADTFGPPLLTRVVMREDLDDATHSYSNPRMQDSARLGR